MNIRFPIRRAVDILLSAVLLGILVARAHAQTVDIPFQREESIGSEEIVLSNIVNFLAQSNAILTPATIKEQLHRSSCRIPLAKPSITKVSPQELRERARASCVRVGWYYLCTHCDRWRFALGGGYLLTQDGALGTAYHVAEPPRDLRKGYMIAVDTGGKIFPITEILAANRYSDACILRVKGEDFVPLPLSTNISVDERVYCLGDPMSQGTNFSQGIVRRIFNLPEQRLPHAPGAPVFAPMRFEASVDWSFGSSGAPLLDECGNAIGHASTISFERKNASKENSANAAEPAVFHEAVSARDVLELIKTH